MGYLAFVGRIEEDLIARLRAVMQPALRLEIVSGMLAAGPGVVLRVRRLAQQLQRCRLRRKRYGQDGSW